MSSQTTISNSPFLEKTISKNWWQTGEYRLWDMAAGTGNLEYHLPQEALKYCYLSTLYNEDKEHLDKLFVGANIFQYDYLNDDIENVFSTTINFGNTWKLPEKIRLDLLNPKIKWMILINPPFATASHSDTATGESKGGVADTKLRKKMHTDNLGEVSRELFSQFIFRIKKEFKDKNAHLGLFSKVKYINSNNDQKFRDNVFDFKFERGFVFSSANFSGTSKNTQFPVGMIIWNLSESVKLENQIIELDVFDADVEKTDVKVFSSEHRNTFLNKWIKRPKATVKFPPFSAAITMKINTKDRRDRIAKGFLASLMCKSNDFQNQNYTAFLSGPYVSAGALSVTAENFEQAMVVHAARRLPKATWLNDREQFMQPKTELSKIFISDCTVWSLFSNSNATASLKNVVYEKETYQVRNHFFPFLVSEVKNWRITDTDISITLAGAEATFVSKWLLESELGGFLSAEAKAVLEKGKEIYQFYFAHLNELRSNKFKIEHWDAGWWQIKQVLQDENLQTAELKALKVLCDQLKKKLLPQLGEYGIIR